jgi:hypothetical protein
MRGGHATPDAAMRLKQYRLVGLLGWRGYQDCPANIADDFATIMDEEARMQAEESEKMKTEINKGGRR